ncbi:putative cucumisin [Medicago truncatula]|uniref:Putative cucumisin n=1 Tax=Medicago truncatula TaxID=3880 RepID=A0A396GGA1_MEDTR|nr:putative cucumisin [Medicago truncatula]
MLSLGPIPKKWRGVCAGGANFTCNKKIIGARSYGGDQSARDYGGHGTHTASTASGREVMGVSFYGLAKGTARGGVPSSRIAVYKVCNTDGTCNGNDILAAFDDAIADGVDIITISIGNPIAVEFLKDPIAIGSFHAMEKGILTVQAAGNSGPKPSSVSSIAPWLFSIAATTIDRQIIDKLILGNGKTFINERNLTQIPQLPSSVLVQSYTNSTKYPIAEILMREIFHDKNSPTVASFSSRGPNQLVLEIMKPDISAPGVDILAAYSPIAPLSGNINDKRHVKYNIKSGTSMACPHVAGVAAYVKSFHPDWSPASIKSAIMTTTKPVNCTYNDLAGEFAYGSGNVNPKQAIDPGLVYDITKEDYVQMLCNYGYDANKIKLISGENSSCHRASNRSFVKDINYPALVIPVESQKSFNVKIHRTVTNVGSPNSRYMANVIPIENISISVEPKILSFRSLNEKQSFVVTAVGGADSKRMVSSSSLVWSDGTHRVKSPIIVQRLS